MRNRVYRKQEITQPNKRVISCLRLFKGLQKKQIGEAADMPETYTCLTRNTSHIQVICIAFPKAYATYKSQGGVGGLQI